MTGDNADRGRGWNGDEEAEKAEQLPESQQREHQPDRVKPDRFADELAARARMPSRNWPVPTTPRASKNSLRLGHP